MPATFRAIDRILLQAVVSIVLLMSYDVSYPTEDLSLLITKHKVGLIEDKMRLEDLYRVYDPSFFGDVDTGY